MAEQQLTENYSLWIQPAGPLADKLRAEIAAQAAAYGGPQFEPHVTLLPDIPGGRQHALDTSAALAAQLKVWLAGRHAGCLVRGTRTLLRRRPRH